MIYEPIPQKRCSTCNQYKPNTLDYFGRSDSCAGHINTRCKKCCWRAQQKSHSKKPDYYRQKHREYNQQERANKGDRVRARKKKWRDTNKEKVAQQKKESHARNREKDLERSKRWARAHPERTHELGRANYRANRAERILQAEVHTMKRLARKRSLPDNFTAADWNAALAHFGYRCAVCGRLPDFWHVLAMDHWIPLSSPDCPGTVATNIVPLCHSRTGAMTDDAGCNNSKGNLDAFTWLVSRFGARRAAQIADRIAAYFASLTSER